MKAIWKRELTSLFHNVIAWLFLGVTLFLFGLYFFVYNLSYGYPYIAYSLSAISFIFLITVPVLTMRVLAEERRARTDQLLLTSPVSVGKIVFGKFLALATIYTISVLVICIAPVVLLLFGEIPVLETYVAIFGFWLYGLACIAIGDVCLLFDGKSGHFGCHYLCAAVWGLYDAVHYRADFIFGESSHEDSRLL